MNTGHVPLSRTLGIDLASQPRDTAACLIEWGETKGIAFDCGPDLLKDERLLELITDPNAVRVGIDAPFGFPLAFADALNSYWRTGTWPELPPSELRFRATENFVRKEFGVALSAVASDLVWPAMRCASLLSRASDGPVKRVGGRVVEVYPGAALRRWFPDLMAPGAGSYKDKGPGRLERREQIVSTLAAKLGAVVEIGAELRARCVDSDDQLDALVGALVARACDRGHVDAIPEGSRWLALREGWIMMPTADALAHLV